MNTVVYEPKKMKMIWKILLWVLSPFLLMLAYICLFSLPVALIDLPGFRQRGDPLQGAWSWGTQIACYNSQPVLLVEETNGSWVINGKRDWLFFSDMEFQSNGVSAVLSAKVYLPNDKREKIPKNIVIEYSDKGKELLAKTATLDGKKVKPGYFKLKECGYPSLVASALVFFGVEEYWKNLHE